MKIKTEILTFIHSFGLGLWRGQRTAEGAFDTHARTNTRTHTQVGTHIHVRSYET